MKYHLDSWESPPPTPPALASVANYIPGAAAAPSVEGSQAGGRHPPHRSALYLVSGGIPGPLVVQSRVLKSPLFLLLLLLNYSVAYPSPRDNVVLSVPRRWQGSGSSPESLAWRSPSLQDAQQQQCRPLLIPPPPWMTGRGGSSDGTTIAVVFIAVPSSCHNEDSSSSSSSSPPS